MNHQPHRVAIVGFGFQGQNLAAAIRDTPQLQLAAVVPGDNTEISLDSLAGGEVDKAPLDSVLADDSIALVIVATPNHAHASITDQVLKAGKSAFVEKPLALNPAEVEQIMGHPLAPGQRLIVGHALRTAPGIRRMLELIFDGTVGQVASIDTRRSRLVRPPNGAKTWKQDPEKSGGEVLHEIHELDLACLVGGTVKDTSSYTTRVGAGERTESSRHSILRFDTGAIAHHTISATNHRTEWSFTVSGSQGTIHADLTLGSVTHFEDGAAVSSWGVFDDLETNETLILASQGATAYNRPGKVSRWMSTLASCEMHEVARILDGADGSLLLKQPSSAVRVAFELLAKGSTANL